MKKNVIILLAIAVLSLPCIAQKKDGAKKDKAEWRKELQDFKYKYLAQEMELKEDQQTKFFELYSKMESELNTAKKDCNATCKAVKKAGDTATDAQYEKAVDAMINEDIIEGQIKKRYYEEFKKFLTPKQLYQLKESERKFYKKLKEMRKKGKKDKK